MTTLPPLPPAEDYGYRDDNGTWVQQPLYAGTDMRAYGAACAAAAAAAERAKCGGENCMGRRLDGNTNWVTEAARDAAVAAERDRCALIAAIHSQYPVTADYDLGYAKARDDAAAAIRALKESK